MDPVSTPPHSSPSLGVVIVTFNSSSVILDCLETLLASAGVTLRVAVIDNGSTDDTCNRIRRWANGEEDAQLPDLPFHATPAARPVHLADRFGTAPERSQHEIVLVETGLNRGFAGGVNLGLDALAPCEEVDRFWILNPDSVVPPGTAAAFATYAAAPEGFALLGGRVLYLDTPEIIQIDGGTLNERTGVTGNIGLYQKTAETPPPDPREMSFVTGASMVASREFYEMAGPMTEDYFLYYEEVDWALRRDKLPLAYCAEGVIYHHGGTSIGSATHNRPASEFALYFKHRARLLFMRRFFPHSLPVAHAWTLAKAAQLFAKGQPKQARALLKGAWGGSPPDAVRTRLSDASLEIASTRRS